MATYAASVQKDVRRVSAAMVADFMAGFDVLASAPPGVPKGVLVVE